MGLRDAPLVDDFYLLNTGYFPGLFLICVRVTTCLCIHVASKGLPLAGLVGMDGQEKVVGG